MKAILHNRSRFLWGLAESIRHVGNGVTVMAIYAVIVFHGEGGGRSRARLRAGG